MVIGDQGVRLVLAHHAGGSRLAYRGWEEHLPDDWEVLALDVPGRGLAHDRPPARDLDEVAAALLDRALDGLDRPLALFGHSMGAAVVSRMAGLLLAGCGPAPVWLGLSGWTARPGRGRAGVEAMTDGQFLDLLADMGGTPPGLLADPALRRFVLPALRADLAVLEEFDPVGDTTWLETPISVFGGRDDPGATEARLAGLAAAARRLIGVHVHPGGHFYLAERPGEIARQIVHDVRSAQRATATPNDPQLITRGT
ncbi:alpha/beta fold hydrolase [Umezawaea sp. Da 62-37]|uniref:thioesterase II family protein n=1 Tax=Umezawaea sp. Da 62-37 TaxID=3075927 RepID=UPI0028F6D933|nr:alpha/beta fold hydrolase [Umezawaea sp. Da 62-37]WNV87751.1 alpha/beta fold hydrolase [Umezawaea sp. Da 62-37]